MALIGKKRIATLPDNDEGDIQEFLEMIYVEEKIIREIEKKRLEREARKQQKKKEHEGIYRQMKQKDREVSRCCIQEKDPGMAKITKYDEKRMHKETKKKRKQHVQKDREVSYCSTIEENYPGMAKITGNKENEKLQDQEAVKEKKEQEGIDQEKKQKHEETNDFGLTRIARYEEKKRVRR